MAEPSRRRQTESIFQSALQLDAIERVAFLDRACAGDEDLRKDVESLLGALDQAGSFLQDPAAGIIAESMAAAATDSWPSLRQPLRIKRTSSPFFWSVIAASAVILGGYILGALMIVQYGGLVAEIGWSAERHGEQWRVSEIAPSGPAFGRLEPGDVVLAVDGDERAGRIGPFPDLLQRNLLRFHSVNPAGGTYTVRVIRGQRVLEVEMPLTVHHAAGLLTRSLSLLAASLAFYVVGTLVGLLRPRDRMPQMLVKSSLASALTLLAMALMPASQFAQGHERYLLLATFLIYPFHLLLGYGFFHRLVVNGKQARPFWASLERGLWTLGSIVFIPRSIVLPISLTEFDAAMDWAANHTLLYFGISAFATTSQRLFDSIVYLAMCGVLIVNYRQVSDVDWRRRLKWIVYGTAAGLIPLVLVFLAGTLLRPAIIAPAIPIATIFTILIPITFAYAIARYRVLGVQVVVRRGIRKTASLQQQRCAAS